MSHTEVLGAASRAGDEKPGMVDWWWWWAAARGELLE